MPYRPPLHQSPTLSPITESPASAIATTETTAQPAAKTSGAPGKHEAARHVASVQLPVAAAPGLYQAEADQPRLHISGRPRKLVYPVCPRTDARGKVSLQAVVSDDGAVDRVKVLTGDRVLAAAAIEAVRQWRYEPFFRGNPGVERETDITVSFISDQVVAVSFPDAAPVSR